MYFLLVLLCGIAAARCFDPTPSFPLPGLNAYNPLLDSTFKHIHSELYIAAQQKKYENVSFAVEVTSSTDSLWSMAYTSPANKAAKEGVKVVDDKTIFRIASITKTFTVLGILYQHAAGNLSLDDPVLKYLPELEKSASTNLAWKDTTIRVLASQLSGLFRDVTFEDAYNKATVAEVLGLPPNVSTKSLPTCGEYSDFKIPCNASDLYAGFVGRSGPYAPNQKSTYSNDAFSILGLVLANVTGVPYSTYIDSAIFAPLGMNSTTLDPPPRSAGIIPPGPHWYGIDDDANRPTGGIYSCTRDMSAYLRYALTHYNGLTHGAVNWFHPQSFADGSHSTYGMPWEILRTDKVLRGTTRPVTFVTKSGGVPGYASRITMSAEHGLGVTILVAGGSEFLEVAQELVTVPLVRAADRVALEQLQRYEGTYVAVGGSNADHEEALNTTLTVRNVKHTGLRITRFVSNGTDVLAGLRRVLGLRASTHLQLTPTLLYKNFERQAGEAWRAVAVEDPSDGPSGAVWDDLCITNVEYQDYAGVPFNELVFWMGLGEVRELELPGYRIKLRKVEHWDELREHANLASDGQQALVAPGAEV